MPAYILKQSSATKEKANKEPKAPDKNVFIVDSAVGRDKDVMVHGRSPRAKNKSSVLGKKRERTGGRLRARGTKAGRKGSWAQKALIRTA